MDSEEKNAVQNYHRLRMGKSDSYVQGWKNSQSQLKRFEILTEFGDFSDCAVLDLGCGLGDFKTQPAKCYFDLICFKTKCCIIVPRRCIYRFSLCFPPLYTHCIRLIQENESVQRM